MKKKRIAKSFFNIKKKQYLKSVTRISKINCKKVKKIQKIKNKMLLSSN